MNKRLKLTVIILSVLLLVLGAVALVLALTGKEAPKEISDASSQMQTEQPDGSLPPESIPVEELTKPSEQDASAAQPSTDEDGTGDPLESAMPTGTPQSSQPPTEVPEDISFPYTIPDTGLIISKIDSYDGIFLEDGSDRNVSGICALVLTNSGDTDVEYADISIKQGSRELLFKATVLKVGCTVVVQEANAAAYLDGAYQSCTAQVAEAEELGLCADQVKIKENQDGSLTVTNLTDQNIVCIRIFYKFCLPEGGVYVGGITYTAKVENLAAGATQTVYPTHYSLASSEVVMVRLYDSLD